MKHIFIFLLFSCLPVIIHAADIPPVVIGAEKYDEKMCIDRRANDCINTICLTSSARDCIAKCKSAAVDKCNDLAQ